MRSMELLYEHTAEQIAAAKQFYAIDAKMLRGAGHQQNRLEFLKNFDYLIELVGGKSFEETHDLSECLSKYHFRSSLFRVASMVKRHRVLVQKENDEYSKAN